MQYYNRYIEFESNGVSKILPFIKIKKQDTDKTILYELGKTRLDIVSDTYYNDPLYGWLILQANPEYGGIEFLIPDQSLIRIPFPFDSALGRYITEVQKYKNLYG